MCQGTTPASSAPWSSPTPEACGTFRKIYGYTTDFRYSIVMLVSLDFSPKGNFKHQNHQTIFGIDHYLEWMQCWFELHFFGPWAYDTYGWEGWSMAKVNQSLCSMTATLGAPSPPAHANIITQKMQRLCCTACSQTNFMRRLLHRCSCFCCLDQAILNTWTNDGFHMWFPHAHQNSNPSSLSTVLLKFQNSSAQNAQTV